MTQAIVVRASGHEHVSARHESTFEITTDDWLTPAGDCIIGVAADNTPQGLPTEFTSACRNADATITVSLAADGHTDIVSGHGSPELSFDSDRSFVCRTSEYVDDRTVMVGADAAAGDLDRDLIAALESGAALRARFEVEPGDPRSGHPSRS